MSEPLRRWEVEVTVLVDVLARDAEHAEEQARTATFWLECTTQEAVALGVVSDD